MYSAGQLKGNRLDDKEKELAVTLVLAMAKVHEKNGKWRLAALEYDTASKLAPKGWKRYQVRAEKLRKMAGPKQEADIRYDN